MPVPIWFPFLFFIRYPAFLITLVLPSKSI
nr:MAG TPA: hypothetical protein [Caudoviricetes sp.]